MFLLCESDPVQILLQSNYIQTALHKLAVSYNSVYRDIIQTNIYTEEYYLPCRTHCKAARQTLHVKND